MSFNRENVIWLSPTDHMWYRGFFACYPYNDWDNEDYDPEWDVEYDFSRFEWTSGPHANEEAAWASWTGANPGGHWTDIDPERCAEFDRMFKEYR